MCVHFYCTVIPDVKIRPLHVFELGIKDTTDTVYLLHTLISTLKLTVRTD